VRLLAAVALAAVLVAGSGLAACSEGDPGADGDVESLGDLVPSPVADELTESGRCDDTRLWAGDEGGTLSVSVDAGRVDEAVLPSEEVEVAVFADEDPCRSSADGDGSRAVQGRLEVDRDADGCVTGFRLDGLEAADGTTFGPIEASVPPC
jgi:hypothetical protein